MRRPAPAKINLYLHVTGRRGDGYHELESLIVFAGVGDEIAVRPGHGFRLATRGPFADRLAAAGGAGEANIVAKAVRSLAARCRRPPDVSVTLVKNLPVAAGLGGGSADAAAVLAALTALWAIDLSADELADLAFDLGADVPACLKGRPMLVGGAGDVLRPAPDLPPAHVLLVNPSVPLSTAAVFAALQLPAESPPPLVAPPRDVADLAAELARRRNDLEPPARALVPEIDRVLAWLTTRRDCLLARMSGSGATCFGLFADAAAARAAERAARAERPDWWARAAPLLRVPSSTGARP